MGKSKDKLKEITTNNFDDLRYVLQKEGTPVNPSTFEEKRLIHIRSKLEDNIQSCWLITQDLEDLQALNNIDLQSTIDLYNYKFDKLWNTFEALLEILHEEK